MAQANIVTRESLLIRFLSDLGPIHDHHEMRLAVNAFLTRFEAKRAVVYGREDLHQTYLKLADKILDKSIEDGEILY